MALSNAEKQARHRALRSRAIRVLEDRAGITLRQVMAILKSADACADDSPGT